MKLSFITIYFGLCVIAGCAEKTYQDHLGKLMVASQNLQFELSLVAKGAAVEDKQYAEYTSDINKSLSGLVKTGDVKHKKVNLGKGLTVDELNLKLEPFRMLSYKMSEKYGHYVSTEMLGIGNCFKLKSFKFDEEVILDTYLNEQNYAILIKLIEVKQKNKK